ncbi:hypothetical protein pb186bvf_005502 [Paramecium bursaria]
MSKITKESKGSVYRAYIVYSTNNNDIYLAVKRGTTKTFDSILKSFQQSLLVSAGSLKNIVDQNNRGQLFAIQDDNLSCYHCFITFPAPKEQLVNRHLGEIKVFFNELYQKQPNMTPKDFLPKHGTLLGIKLDALENEYIARKGPEGTISDDEQSKNQLKDEQNQFVTGQGKIIQQENLGLLQSKPIQQQNQQSQIQAPQTQVQAPQSGKSAIGQSNLNQSNLGQSNLGQSNLGQSKQSPQSKIEARKIGRLIRFIIVFRIKDSYPVIEIKRGISTKYQVALLDSKNNMEKKKNDKFFEYVGFNKFYSIYGQKILDEHYLILGVFPFVQKDDVVFFFKEVDNQMNSVQRIEDQDFAYKLQLITDNIEQKYVGTQVGTISEGEESKRQLQNPESQITFKEKNLAQLKQNIDVEPPLVSQIINNPIPQQQIRQFYDRLPSSQETEELMKPAIIKMSYVAGGLSLIFFALVISLWIE